MRTYEHKRFRPVYYITLMLTTALVLLTMLTVNLLLSSANTAEAVQPSELPAQEEFIAASAELTPVRTGYTVTLSGGELRLYSAANPGEYSVIDGIDARTLRENDRAELERGVVLESEEELREFMEDYGS
jgi:hypothetical protein